MELARLEAGKEHREISEFDAAALLTELGDINQPMARNQGLFLRVSGPPMLTVEGDSGKVRRLLQNLILNALKYTRQGGVSVSWGEDKANWWLIVEDTGPGLPSASGESMVLGLTEATASARESDEKTAAGQGNISQVLTPKPAAGDPGTTQHQSGEGIGLSIVKRLCELLDASLELASSAHAGTTFRVVLPRRYQIAA
jgi:signal transduction histidine kinase